MRTAALAIALTMSGAAIAQTYEPDVDPTVTPAEVAAATDPTLVATADVTPATTPIVQPGNLDPEISARGIAVISDPALVPPGWNGMVVTAVGGPLVDPVTGETIDADDLSYPPCTADVTDNCVQTYERGIPG